MRYSKTVETYQNWLKRLGFDPGPIDGLYGPQTIGAILAYQEDRGLLVDGIVGPQTWNALKNELDHKSGTAIEPDKSAMESTEYETVDHSNNDLIIAPPNPVTLLHTSRTINEIIFHCAATPEGRDFTVDDIRAWHKTRGWKDIGYHYVVYRNGEIHVGRPVGQIGAHVANHNTGTIGVCYIGGVASDGKTAKDTRTNEQRASLLWIAEKLTNMYPAIHLISGHNQYASKACPSFDVRKDALGNIKGFKKGKK